MFEAFIQRENTIFDVLDAFIYEKLDFIVIGGYGVNAYKHRFSVDADIVIEEHDKSRFEKILMKLNFLKTLDKALDHIYTKNFVRYQTKGELKVSIDLLSGELGQGRLVHLTALKS